MPARNDVKTLVQQKMNTMIQSLPGTDVAQKRFKTAALAVASNPGIQQCEPVSVLKAVYTCARLNLYPDPALHHAAIVPFKNGKTGKREATLIIEYRGLVELAKRANPKLSLRAGTVYENDDYELVEGTYDELKIKKRYWEKGLEDPGQPILFYAIADEGEGRPITLTVPAVEARKIGRASKAGMKRGTPWHDHFERMGEKTAIRRLMRFLRFDPDKDEANRLQQAVEWDERTEDQGEAGLHDDEDLFGEEQEEGPPPDVVEQAPEMEEGEHAAGNMGGGRQKRDPNAPPTEDERKKFGLAVDKKLMDASVAPDPDSRKRVLEAIFTQEERDLLADRDKLTVSDLEAFKSRVNDATGVSL
jgi:recombination protein RecT